LISLDIFILGFIVAPLEKKHGLLKSHKLCKFENRFFGLSPERDTLYFYSAELMDYKWTNVGNWQDHIRRYEIPIKRINEYSDLDITPAVIKRVKEINDSMQKPSLNTVIQIMTDKTSDLELELKAQESLENFELCHKIKSLLSIKKSLLNWLTTAE